MNTFGKALLLVSLLVSVSSYGQVQNFGGVDVNYNVITTDTLAPEVAKAYGIERSKHRALLTVAVTRANPLGVPRPIPAKISAYTVNLIEQQRPIAMHDVSEGGAVYYIGDFAFASPDVLRFTLNVDEADTGRKHRIEFERTY